MKIQHRLALAMCALVLLTTLSSCAGGTTSSTVSAAPVPAAVATATPSPVTEPPVDASTALFMLKQGNARYVQGTNYCYNRTVDRPMELNAIQHPISVVLGCSDSRVDPQLAFDQSWGQLFVQRVAGNVGEPYMLGSAEYAVTVLQTKLIVVLGHEGCGAVDAAVKGEPLPGHLGDLIDLIVPAVESVRNQPGDLLENSIIANVQQSVNELKTDPVLMPYIGPGNVVVVGALYHLTTGEITYMLP